MPDSSTPLSPGQRTGSCNMPSREGDLGDGARTALRRLAERALPDLNIPPDALRRESLYVERVTSIVEVPVPDP